MWTRLVRFRVVEPGDEDWSGRDFEVSIEENRR